MKTGLLYRSDDPTRATDRDLRIIQNLNIQLICDLRSPEEFSRPALAGIRVVNIPLHDHSIQNFNHWTGFGFLLRKDGGDRFLEFTRNYYRHLAVERASEIGQVLRLIATEGNQPTLIHCRAGKDRTGLIAALLQLLVGVPYGTVMQDYLETNISIAARVDKVIQVLRVFTLFQASPERIRLLSGVRGEDLDRVHRQILTGYGSIDGYLGDACGIDAATLSLLRHRLLN
jgi:protein-tyrosine phosphatase